MPSLFSSIRIGDIHIGSRSNFASTARKLGVRRRVARTLEKSARELFGDEPGEAFASRAAFEQVATHAVVGDAGNLELSYQLVDILASTVETLGFARASDVPDPFRRVWISHVSGARRRGVVLRCEGGEVAVFCPPANEKRSATGAERRSADDLRVGDTLKLSYRGFTSSVEFELRLADAVCLPGALVLHLTRPGDPGAIGRDNARASVHLAAQVRVIGRSGVRLSSPQLCHILDVSAGGMRISSDLSFGSGQNIEIEVILPGGSQPTELPARICWNRVDDSGERCQGVMLLDLTVSAKKHYTQFLQLLDTAPEAEETAPAAAEETDIEEARSEETVAEETVAEEAVAEEAVAEEAVDAATTEALRILAGLSEDESPMEEPSPTVDSALALVSDLRDAPPPVSDPAPRARGSIEAADAARAEGLPSDRASAADHERRHTDQAARQIAGLEGRVDQLGQELASRTKQVHLLASALDETSDVLRKRTRHLESAMSTITSLLAREDASDPGGETALDAQEAAVGGASAPERVEQGAPRGGEGRPDAQPPSE